MKTTSDSIFKLIRSMRQGEKRYFSLVAAPYSSAADGNRYLLLFRAIDKQERYDEEALKRKFSADPFLGTHFKKAKSTLYRMILKSLQGMHRDDHSEINDYIHQARILFRKGLHAESKKQLTLAKKLAEEKEYFTGMIDACEQERSIVAVGRAYREEWAKQIPVMMNHKITQLSNLQSIRNVEAEIFGYFTKHDVVRTPFQRTKLHKLGERLFGDAPVPQSSKAAAVLYNSMGTFNQQLGNLKEARMYFKKVREHFDDPKNESQVISYAMIQSNIINASIGLKKYDEALKELRVVQAICETYPASQRLFQVQCSLSHALMSMYITSGQFDEGLIFSESVRKKNFANAILRDKLLFAFNRAVLNFGTGKFRQTLSLTNEVLAVPDAENPIPKLNYWSRMLQLLSLWELGDYDLMGHRIKSFHNYVQKTEELHEQEKTIFEFIRIAFLANTALFYEGTANRLLIGLREKIKPRNQRVQQKGQEYFDIDAWVESKITGKSFGDIVRKRN